MQITCLQLKQQKGHHPTVLIDHGMNPGLISHFVKLSLKQLAREQNVKFTTHAEVARKLKIETIHCSEYDSQTTIYDKNPEKDVFYNTWSSIGFYEEGTLPCQISWNRANEKPLDIPHDVDIEEIFLRQMGIETLAKGYNPLSGFYYGYIIPHAESSSISRYLSYKGTHPSCYYVYKPSYVAEKSWENVKKNDYDMLKRYLVVNGKEITSGHDAVG